MPPRKVAHMKKAPAASLQPGLSIVNAALKPR